MTSVMTPPTDRALRFVEPLLGFGDEDAYTLTEIDPDGVLLALRSVQDPTLRFVLTPAECFFDGYRPDLAGDVTDALGSDLRLLLMLTIGTELSEATANLRAPIVVSPSTGRAMQVVLDDDTLPMQQALIAK